MTLKQQRDLHDIKRIKKALIANKGHRRATSIDLYMSERTLYRYLKRFDLQDFGKINLDNPST